MYPPRNLAGVDGPSALRGWWTVGSPHLHLFSERCGNSAHVTLFTNTDSIAQFLRRSCSSQPGTPEGRDRSNSSLKVVECRPSMTEPLSRHKSTTGAMSPSGSTLDRNAAEIGSPEGIFAKRQMVSLLFESSLIFLC